MKKKVTAPQKRSKSPVSMPTDSNRTLMSSSDWRIFMPKKMKKKFAAEKKRSKSQLRIQKDAK